MIKGLKVADVILGMTFLCHENATINCAEKRVIFPDNDFVQCNDKIRRAHCLVLSPTKFAKLLRQDGGLRLCVDYRGLNEKPVKGVFPLPRVNDLLVELREANVFTHLNLA